MTSSMTVPELRKIMADNNIAEPEGTGDKGKVVKKDLVQAIKDSEVDLKGIKKEPKVKAEKPAEKPPAKAKSPTAGLKSGDRVRFFDEGKYDFEATVTGRIVSTKAMITPVADVDDTYKAGKEFDAYRKNLSIINEDAVGANSIKMTIKGSGKTIHLDIQNVDIDQLTDAITTSILDASEIKYVKK